LRILLFLTTENNEIHMIHMARLARNLLLLTVFATAGARASAQAPTPQTMNDLKIALMLRLCQYVSYKGEPDTFKMMFFSKNDAFMKKVSEINGMNIPGMKRHIVAVQNPVAEQARNAQFVFVDQEQSPLVSKLWPIINKRHVLLFTENHKVAKEIMFNLLPNSKSGAITFELNRTNLILEGFDIDNKIIELRGSEVDVRDLYRQMKTRLEEEEQKMSDMQSKLDSQKKTIEQHDELISSQNTRISKLNDVVDSQLQSIAAKEHNMTVLSNTSKTQQGEILQNKSLISEQQGMIITSERKFKFFSTKLDSLDKLIAQKEHEISKKTSILEEKEQLLTYKNKQIYFQVALIILSFLLVFVVVNAYMKNKIIQHRLSQQKEELQATLEKLTSAQEQLLRAEKMASLGILTAGIAHEINNPINFINSGLSGLKKINSAVLKLLGAYRKRLQETNLPEDVELLEREYDLPFLSESSVLMIDNISIGIDRSVKIINSLRSFARSDDETLSSINIHENIDMALTILTNQYKYNIEIIKKYGMIDPVYCFSGKINQVFMNLISNAIQAIPEKGHIWISTVQDGDNVYISVKDDGIGIPDEIKGKIFDPFFTTKEAGKGTGMGLSIAFRIIEEHKGSITVKSSPGQGTEFTVKLPKKFQD